MSALLIPLHVNFYLDTICIASCKIKLDKAIHLFTQVERYALTTRLMGEFAKCVARNSLKVDNETFKRAQISFDLIDGIINMDIWVGKTEPSFEVDKVEGELYTMKPGAFIEPKQLRPFVSVLNHYILHAENVSELIDGKSVLVVTYLRSDPVKRLTMSVVTKPANEASKHFNKAVAIGPKDKAVVEMNLSGDIFFVYVNLADRKEVKADDLDAYHPH